jgi:4-oxalomesaconate tautomerase
VSQRALPSTLIRGGTSKGLYFKKEDLPSDVATRDAVLLAAMGSPDPRQIDGVGGANPLTSKVAVVSVSERPDADVDYLFLQVWPDRAEVSDNQNCGNLLAGVGPFALEEGLMSASGDVTPVRIWMENTSSLAVAHVPTPGGQVSYEGSAHIDGVPGTHAPIMIDFLDVAGSSCGALLPTGNVRETIDGVDVTLIDNGMPVVCLKASDFGLTGNETPAEIESREDVKARVESIRLQAGVLMNLGDVTNDTVPKMSLLSPASNGGAVSTRTFIPKRVHDAIGVFGAVSVATACALPHSVANEISGLSTNASHLDLDIEHPTGYFSVSMDVSFESGEIVVERSALLRTARRLMKGEVYVPRSVWSN